MVGWNIEPAPSKNTPRNTDLKTPFLIALLLLAFGLCHIVAETEETTSPTNEAPPSPHSSVQFINATSVPNLDLDIKGFHKYEKIPQGTKISGGDFPFTSWKLRIQKSGSTDPKAYFEKELNQAPNTASTVVLLGNLEWKQDASRKKQELQAAIVNFDHELAADEKPNTLTIVNGLIQQILRVSINESEFLEIAPMSHHIWHGLPETIEATALIGSQQIRVPLKYNGSFQSGIVAFYEADGTIKFTAAPQLPFE